MKIYLIRRSYFTFRGTKSCDLPLAGASCLERMKHNLGAEVVDAPPAGEKLVLYPVYPFLTAEDVARFAALHAGSVRFAGGYLERSAPFSEEEGFPDGLFSLGQYPALQTRAYLESAAYHLRQGALVEEGARVDVTVRLGRGAIVRQGACVTGGSVVGEDAVVSGGSFVEDSAVGAGTQVVMSRLFGAKVGKRCTVGPYATLRPASLVGDDVRIGSFVEVKNASVGDGCKIAHLAYVGDAELGSKVNVGCGVVFVNYDGRRKHRSYVGDGSFLGSNCNLVAPVRIGAGCFLAAGTTLTRDMADGDFCIGRSRESVRPKGAEKYLG